MAITPYLYYENVAGALDFLSKAFGFEKFGASMSKPDGTVVHAAMKLGKDSVMMGWPGPNYRSPKKLGQTTQRTSTSITHARRRPAPRSSRSRRTPSTATGGMGPSIPKDTSGISRRGFESDEVGTPFVR